MLDLYKNIREKRQALKMSQEELALKVGYTNRSTIATIESGKMDIPISKIKDIASALNCSASELMGWSNESSLTAEDGIRDAELLNKYHRLTDECKDMIDKQIDLFLNMQK